MVYVHTCSWAEVTWSYQLIQKRPLTKRNSPNPEESRNRRSTYQYNEDLCGKPRANFLVNGMILSSLPGKPGTRHGSSWSSLWLSLSLVLRVLASEGAQQDRRGMWVQTGNDVNPSLLADNTGLCLKTVKTPPEDWRPVEYFQQSSRAQNQHDTSNFPWYE